MRSLKGLSLASLNPTKDLGIFYGLLISTLIVFMPLSTPLSLIGLGVYSLIRLQGAVRPLLRDSLRSFFFWGPLLLFVWGAITSRWHLFPQDAWSLLGRQLGLFLSALLFIGYSTQISPERSLFLRDLVFFTGTFVLGLFALACLLGFLLAHTGVPKQLLFNLRPSSAILATFGWIWLYSLAGRFSSHKRIVLAGYVALLFLLFCQEMRASPLAWLISGGVYLLVLLRKAIVLKALGGLLLMGAMLPPFVTYFSSLPLAKEIGEKLPTSWQHRIHIWAFVSQKIGEKPLTGWGWNSSRSIPQGKDFIEGQPYLEEAERLPLHPHNNFLQIWLELGGAGVLIVCLGLAVALKGLSKLPQQKAAFAIAAFASYLFIGSASFSLWQSWWVAAGWLGVGLFKILFENAEENSLHQRG